MAASERKQYWPDRHCCTDESRVPMDTVVAYYFTEHFSETKLETFQHFCHKAAVTVCIWSVIHIFNRLASPAQWFDLLDSRYKYNVFELLKTQNVIKTTNHLFIRVVRISVLEIPIILPKMWDQVSPALLGLLYPDILILTLPSLNQQNQNKAGSVCCAPIGHHNYCF